MLYPGFVVNFIVLLNLLKYANEVCLVFFLQMATGENFSRPLKEKKKKKRKKRKKEGERERKVQKQESWKYSLCLPPLPLCHLSVCKVCATDGDWL